MRIPLDGDSASAHVLRTGRSARTRTAAEGTIGDILRRQDVTVSIGAPIVVNGAVWGVIAASWRGDDGPPDDAEERLVEFAELVDTAIANADSTDQLTASRARVISAADEARRRVVRDLHDGAQQRLIHTIILLKLAQRALGEGDRLEAASLVSGALDHAVQGNAELRELAHGILPSVLTRGGLRAGVDTLVARVDLPVEVDVDDSRVPPDIEASAYFVVAEALTNAVKHSRAKRVKVSARLADGTLRVEVGDDGVGGADPDGRGLTGIADRVAAFRGSLRIESPPGGGTLLTAEFPVPS
jgi:signal transduction histidine kinase